MGHGFGNSVMLQVAPFQAPATYIHTLKIGCGLGRFRSRFQRWPTGRLSWQTVEVRNAGSKILGSSMGTYIHHPASNVINVWKHMCVFILFWKTQETSINLRVFFLRSWLQLAKLPQHQNWNSSLPTTKKRVIVGSANIMGQFDHFSHDFTNVDFHETRQHSSISPWQGTYVLGIEPYRKGFLSFLVLFRFHNIILTVWWKTICRYHCLSLQFTASSVDYITQNRTGLIGTSVETHVNIWK